jgi:hypothetical protein
MRIGLDYSERLAALLSKASRELSKLGYVSVEHSRGGRTLALLVPVAIDTQKALKALEVELRTQAIYETIKQLA